MPRCFKALVASFPFFFLLLTLSLLSPSKALAATFTVTKTADTNDGTCDADCSLREAVAAANANASHDTIEFDIPTSDAGYVPASGDVHAYWKITINSPLTLTDNEGAFLNGYSQAGASRNTAPFGETINTVLTIQLYFNDDTYQLGFDLITSDNNHLAGFNIVKERWNSSSRYIVNGGNNNWLEGSFWGTDITGTTTIGGNAIRFLNSDSNTIGTNGDGAGDVGERNLFGGSEGDSGILIFGFATPSNDNTVSGNYFGTDNSGNKCIGASIHRNIISMDTSTGNLIGTNFDGISDVEERNILGCVNNTYKAVVRLLAGANNNHIQGNYIGVSPSGGGLGTLFGTGLGAIDMGANVTGNLIKGNSISNGAYGIRCTSTCTNNSFLQNKILANELLDISIASSTPLVNDLGDLDTGPNNLMNHPMIEQAEFKGDGRYYIQGTLDSNPAEAPFTIEVCKSSEHISSHGGCLEPLGTTTTSGGFWSLDVEVSGDTWDNLSIFTALATNVNGSTSEFGPNKGGVLKPEGPRREAHIARQPDFVAQTGGVVGKEQVVSVALPGSFLWDVYLDVSLSPQVSPRFLGSGYWQASPVYEVWYKAFFNDAKVLPQVIAHPFILALKYDLATLDPNLPVANLKLAYSADEGKTWSLLPDSVLDRANQTVAVLTKKGGHYMLVSGYTTRLPRLPLVP